ncbi:MAG: hypothetical protein V1913_03675 [Fibrobacterota bacterium]
MDLNLLFTGVVAISTVVYATLTWRLAAETIRMRKSQTDPRITVYLQASKHSINFMDVIFENIGSGPALDVQFKVLKEFPLERDRELSKMGVVKNGVKFWAPRQRIMSFFFSFLGNYEKVINEEIVIRVMYKNSLKEQIVEDITINMAQFAGIHQLGDEPIYKMASALDKIKDSIDKISTGRNKLQVDVFDEDYRIERRRVEEEEYNRFKTEQEAKQAADSKKPEKS